MPKICRSLFRSKPPYPLHLQALSSREDAPKIFPPPPPPNHLELLKNMGSNPSWPRDPKHPPPKLPFQQTRQRGEEKTHTGGVPTPSIPPKAHPPPIANSKSDSSAHQLPIHPYSFPKPHTACLSHFLRAPTPSIFPILSSNHLIPQSLSLICKSPIPFGNESLIENGKTFDP